MSVRIKACRHLPNAFNSCIHLNSGKHLCRSRWCDALLSFKLCLQSRSPPCVSLYFNQVLWIQVFYGNLGHMEVFETCMARFLGIEHDADLIQLPMGGLLESAGLGSFVRPLYRRFGCESVSALVHLKDACLEEVGMDKAQVFACLVSPVSMF